MAFEEKYKEIADILAKESNIAIFSHAHPDGDSVGSQLGIYNFLKNMGKSNLLIINQDKVPYRFEYLKGSEVILDKTDEDLSDYVALCLDASDLKRFGQSIEVFINQCKMIINIDHHVSNAEYGKINIVDPAASSTCEMMHTLMNAFSDRDKYFDIAVAEAIYNGIATDTGRFAYTNTNGDVMRLAAELLDFGVDPQKISNNVFANDPYEYYLLLGRAMERMQLLFDGKFAIIYVDESMYEDIPRDTTTENFVNYARSIRGVEIAVFLKEDELGIVRGNMRSKGNIVVNKIAEKFGGGGHPFAAGFRLEGNMENIINELKNEIEKVLV